MSWATRCPSCATVFRVAEDQLRVSEGFVRCGRCDAVFDARAQLFDLESGAPLQAPAPAPDTGWPAPPQAPLAAANPPEPPESDGFATFAPSDAAQAGYDAAAEDPPEHWQDDAHARIEPGLVSGPGAPEPEFGEPPHAPEPAVAEPQFIEAEDAAARMRSLLGADSGAQPLEPAAAPFASLMRQAPPRPLWRPLAWLGLALLALGLPLQWAWIERESLRAQWPAVETLWLRLCASCEPVALARLDGLVVASSSLQPTPQGQAYQLRLRIENRAPHALRLPWVDLQLTDATGRRLLRRSLSPADLGQSARRIEAGAAMDLQATFRLDGRLAGYEVGLFHP